MSEPAAAALPRALALALPRLREMARAAGEQVLREVAAAGESSTNVFERDSLLIAHFEFNRQQALWISAFADALQEKWRAEVQPRGSMAASGLDWQSLSLVDDREVETQVAADRFARPLAEAAEAEFRQVQAFAAALRGQGAAGSNTKLPLRAELLAWSALHALGPVAPRDDVYRVLETALGRAFKQHLPAALQQLIGDWRQAGIAEVALEIRARPSAPSAARAADPAGHASAEGLRSGPGELPSVPGGQGAGGSGFGALGGTVANPAFGGSPEGVEVPPEGQRLGRSPGPSSAHGALAPLSGWHSNWASTGAGGLVSMGHVQPAMMGVIRRLATRAPVAADAGPSTLSGADLSTGSGFGAFSATGGSAASASMPMPNMIQAHREELRQAASGQLDLMVIDVVSTLFDAILSDPKVPPQMARQIGRMQLPVLRAALGDPSFFSSRRHPVRRFVNRLASLGSAFDDYGSEEAQRFLARVRELVQAVVEGDFERLELYEQQLQQLEVFVAEQAEREAKESGDAARVLAEHDPVTRVHARYVLTLQGVLKTLSAPDFLRDFVAEVWSLVLVQAGLSQPPDPTRVQRFRDAARDLFLSVQPKAGTDQRKAFLAQLPPLMKVLNEGLDFIHWPAAARSAFFGALLPAHARSLKGEVKADGRVEGISTLDYNLMARQLEALFASALPSLSQLPAANPLEAPAPRLDAAQAKAVGLIDEASVDWAQSAPPPPEAEAPLVVADIHIEGLPAAEAPEPVQGQGLADQVQIGFAYQMLLEGEWQKVRLNHVSPGRTFFVFTRGKRHKQAISLTYRMLLKLCESGRLRAFENATLLERATARARRQLAGLAKPAAPA
jgi:hypothetical protein